MKKMKKMAKKKMPAMKKKVVKHLRGDMKSFKKEAKEDSHLIKSLLGNKKPKKIKAKKAAKKVVKLSEHRESKKHEMKERKDKGKGKIEKVMREFSSGDLRSGSKKGPIVTNPKQAIAIGLSEARKAGARIPKKKKTY